MVLQVFETPSAVADSATIDAIYGYCIVCSQARGERILIYTHSTEINSVSVRHCPSQVDLLAPRRPLPTNFVTAFFVWERHSV